MTTKNSHFFQNLPYKFLISGAVAGAVLILLFLSSVDEPDPSWPRWWMIRPLIIVPAAGAGGGFLLYLLTPLRKAGGWKTLLGYILSVAGFIMILWLGTVLGLDGTLWN